MVCRVGKDGATGSHSYPVVLLRMVPISAVVVLGIAHSCPTPLAYTTPPLAGASGNVPYT